MLFRSLAGLYTGFYKDIDFLRGQAAEADVFFPQMEAAARAAKLLAWEEALARAMYRRA
mgnify:CR=1 FL=1